MIWRIRGRQLKFSEPLLMGILNLTPDSFSDGGQFQETQKALQQAHALIRAGAAFIDIGAESTRPGAQPVSRDEELKRLLPVFEALSGNGKTFLSVDTTKPEVAEACLERGAHVVNDVSGLKDSGASMAEVVRRYRAGLIVMHRRGNPQTMQSLANYGDVVRDVMDELLESIKIAVVEGLEQEQLAIDPGLGFAKTAEQNIEILRRLNQFQSLKRPVVLGPSRKSFIGSLTGRPVDQREFGTAAVTVHAVNHGVSVLRVHDVGATRDAMCMARALSGV